MTSSRLASVLVAVFLVTFASTARADAPAKPPPPLPCKSVGLLASEPREKGAPPQGCGRDIRGFALGYAVGSVIGAAIGLAAAPAAAALDSRELTADEFALGAGVGVVLGPLGGMMGAIHADLPIEAGLAAFVTGSVASAGVLIPALAVKNDDPSVPGWVVPLATMGSVFAGIALGSAAGSIALEVLDPDSRSADEPRKASFVAVPWVGADVAGAAIMGEF